VISDLELNELLPKEGYSIMEPPKAASNPGFIPQNEPSTLNLRHIILGGLLLISAVINGLAGKQMQNAMGQHNLFISAIHPLILTPAFVLGVLYKNLFTEDVNEETTSFPKLRFVIMAVFDTVAVVLMTAAGYRVSGSTQGLLGQGQIPISMLVAYVLLGDRYRFGHLAGAAMIVGGAVTASLPAYYATSGAGSDSLPHIGLYILALLPNILGRIYTQKALASQNVEEFYLQAWVTFWQTCFTPLLLPLLAYFDGNSNGVMTILADGATCLMGQNVFKGDNCSAAFLPLCVYLFVNFIFNIMVTLVIKETGTTVFFVLMAIKIPFSQICFSLHTIMGNDAEPLSLHSILAMVLVCIGLAVYRSTAASVKKL